MASSLSITANIPDTSTTTDNTTTTTASTPTTTPTKTISTPRTIPPTTISTARTIPTTIISTSTTRTNTNSTAKEAPENSTATLTSIQVTTGSTQWMNWTTGDNNQRTTISPTALGVGIGGGLFLLLLIVLVAVAVIRIRKRRSKGSGSRESGYKMKKKGDDKKKTNPRKTIEPGVGDVYAEVVPTLQNPQKRKTLLPVIYSTPDFAQNATPKPFDSDYEEAARVIENNTVDKRKGPKTFQKPKDSKDIYANAS